MEETNIETVWLIEDNELKKENKKVVKVIYNDVEIAVLKTELENYRQEYLFKDENNEYWKMNIAEIEFKKFVSASFDNTLLESKNYCDYVVKKLSTLDLRNFFMSKIERKKYFNKCELEYISKYFSNIYDMAKNSREEYIAKNSLMNQEKLVERKQKEKEIVEEVNTTFKKQLKEFKQEIYKDRIVKIVDFEFYKDDKYENGKTKQNCILYLAKQYGINIPLATQGFINNRLTAYHFSKRISYIKRTSNKRCSQTMFKYLDQIYDKVKEEFQNRDVNKYILEECANFNLTDKITNQEVKEYYKQITLLDNDKLSINDKKIYLYDYVVTDMIRNKDITQQEGEVFMKQISKQIKSKQKERGR